ncbi:MAG: ABC transporter permease [Kiritimatiellae bacterium]|nr:ABC transporter permease [Kiritimatiellia bacterium]MBR3777870.1 ABC transporter permease [Kiritimatiellia bacterium]
MFKYVLRRILEAIPTTLGILLITFLLFNVVIGDSPALTILGKGASEESIRAFNRQYGYDKPLIIGEDDFFDSQFFAFMKNVATGDLGYSAKMNEPVKDILKRGVGPSLSLTVPILVFGSVLALFFATLSAAYRGRAPDKIILFVSAVLMSVNYVVWVLLGQFFLAFKAEWFPIWGYGSVEYMILPVMIGVLSSLGMDVRFYRTAILDEIYKPYVLTARSKGLNRFTVMTRHVLRNALIPIVTYISLSIPYLFTGSLLLESFFGIPGLGSVSINAIHSADLAVVRAVVVLGALVYQVVNLVTDVLYAFLDPRVRIAK